MESKNIVPGDLIEIYPKERIPADIRIIKCDDMTVNNFVITGKHSGFDLNALPSTEKPLEAKNLAFWGTKCIKGSGLGVVFNTGDKTILSQINNILDAKINKESVLSNEMK